MTDLSVDPATLAGFGSDLQDIGNVFAANSSRITAVLALPTATDGLLGQLVPALATLRSTLVSAQQQDRSAVDGIATGLTAAGARYLATESASASLLSEAAVSADGQSGPARFGGLNLPSLPEVPEPAYTVQQAVAAGAAAVAQFDEALGVAIGMKPAADYLTPLLADWEGLQAIGKRIRMLGINDYITSGNLTGGAGWLLGGWSGEAAAAFETGVRNLSSAVAQRSNDLEVVGKIVENGGAVLERLVYNQAAGLSSALLQPMTFLDFTLPLGVWAQLIANPMPESVRSSLTAAVDDMTKAAQARRDEIVALVDRVRQAFGYVPGQAPPAYDPNDFDLPDKVSVEAGALRYGFGGNMWWEDSIASAA